ncbi:hypothetical protein HNY73_018323 [Argiope bruennichi]|uniref:Uncharacterized protein n=1 Tax=Argiope bruennichi TaxID=94029 RepID=A0A8T0EDI6_ARGBR|nr:hypothetical protein HNY73_018323 [Argiope bruennichi]
MCSKDLNDQQSLQSQQLIDTDEKLHAPSISSRAFSQLKILNDHLQTHAKPYKNKLTHHLLNTEGFDTDLRSSLRVRIFWLKIDLPLSDIRCLQERIKAAFFIFD